VLITDTNMFNNKKIYSGLRISDAYQNRKNKLLKI